MTSDEKEFLGDILAILVRLTYNTHRLDIRDDVMKLQDKLLWGFPTEYEEE